MINGKDLADAKAGKEWGLGPLLPGVSTEDLKVVVVSKYKTRVTCRVTYFGITLSKFVYHRDTNTYQEVKV